MGRLPPEGPRDVPPQARLQRLIVTRPEAEARTWVQALREQGWPAEALPLIQIAEPRDASTAQALGHWRAQWFELDALMFVSGAAVRHFFAAGMPAAPAASVTRCWAPGPGTARLLAQALAPLGRGPAHIDAPPADAPQFDSEALWPVVAAQVRPGRRVLIVRGASQGLPPAAGGLPPGHGRDWLIRQCEAAGAQVLACVAYERRAPDASEALRARLHAGHGGLWLFSSSEAVAHWTALAPDRAAPGAALVTHPRIAEAARAAGFDPVLESRPALPDVLRALESNWNRP